MHSCTPAYRRAGVQAGQGRAGVQACRLAGVQACRRACKQAHQASRQAGKQTRGRACRHAGKHGGDASMQIFIAACLHACLGAHVHVPACPCATACIRACLHDLHDLHTCVRAWARVCMHCTHGIHRKQACARARMCICRKMHACMAHVEDLPRHTPRHLSCVRDFACTTVALFACGASTRACNYLCTCSHQRAHTAATSRCKL